MTSKIKFLLLPLGLIVFAVVACSFSTANLKDLKIAKDQEGKNETSKIGPSDKFFAVSEVANNSGKVKVKFRVLYDDVKGTTSGDVAKAFDSVNDKVLDIDGSRPVYLELTMPPAGFANGRYRVEVKMLNEKDEVKDTKTATFNVEGFSEEGNE